MKNRATTFTQMLKLEHTDGEQTGAGKNWLCDACDRAPAAFFCKADAASLCATCDSDIHSANPLARRHHRVPIVPGVSYGGETDPDLEMTPYLEGETAGDEYEAASWLLLNPVKNDPALFCGVVDEYLDLDSYNPCPNNNNNGEFNVDPFNINQHQQYNISPDQSKSGRGGDSVVPIQLGLDYASSNVQYNYSAMSHTDQVSLSQLDVGVVPESTTMSENSVSHTRPATGTDDLFSRPLAQVPTQLSAMDREARVLRYREKKKARKFEKTIRYASRKAYAEMRPRIKGRFAKRTEVAEVEVDQMFSASVIAEGGYGIVPSF